MNAKIHDLRTVSVLSDPDKSPCKGKKSPQAHVAFNYAKLTYNVEKLLMPQFLWINAKRKDVGSVSRH